MTASPPQLSPDYGALIRRFPHALGSSCRQLMHVVLVRYLIALLRYATFVWLGRRMRVFDPSGGRVAEMTIRHNQRGMVDLAVARSLTLIRPLMAVDRVSHSLDQAQVLCVGPRTEGELLNLWAHGVRWNQMRGLDLISYSPRIDLGDMHQMPYPENRWDIILLGWVLAYSNDPARAAREVVRVAKPGAVIAIGIEYSPMSTEQIREQCGYIPGSDQRYTSVAQVLSWFGAAVDTVYFRHDVEPEFRDRVGAIVVVFSIKK
jgi:SAM-dependent methyltransferase